MEIIWHGHSCFEIVEDGYSIVIDPFQTDSSGTAFKPIDLEAYEVLIRHDHQAAQRKKESLYDHHNGDLSRSAQGTHARDEHRSYS